MKSIKSTKVFNIESLMPVLLQLARSGDYGADAAHDLLSSAGHAAQVLGVEGFPDGYARHQLHQELHIQTNPNLTGWGPVSYDAKQRYRTGVEVTLVSSGTDVWGWKPNGDFSSWEFRTEPREGFYIRSDSFGTYTMVLFRDPSGVVCVYRVSATGRTLYWGPVFGTEVNGFNEPVGMGEHVGFYPLPMSAADQAIKAAIEEAVNGKPSERSIWYVPETYREEQGALEARTQQIWSAARAQTKEAAYKFALRALEGATERPEVLAQEPLLRRAKEVLEERARPTARRRPRRRD